MEKYMAYKIVGVGSVHIRMFDGLPKPCPMFNTSHIWRKILSLWSLLILLKKGYKADGLYFFQGSTTISAATISTSDNPDLDKYSVMARVWVI